MILAGEGELDVPESFPISMFNHAFLTVPNEGDTIFLECTSQTNPFGYLGTFTSDRNALMVTENGGKLIRTKAYNHSDNIESTKSEIQIDEHGDSDVLISKTYRALEIPEYLEYHYTSNETKENQKKWCYDNFDWGNLSITNLEISPITYERIPNAGFVLEGMISKDAKKTGSRLFYSPIKFANINYIKLPDKERKQSIEIKYPFSQIDSIKIDFPNNYIMETNYDDKELKNKYGYYSREKVMTNEGINVIRKFVLHKGLYPKEEYVDFRGFIRSIQKLDKQRIVLVKE